MIYIVHFTFVLFPIFGVRPSKDCGMFCLMKLEDNSTRQQNFPTFWVGIYIMSAFLASILFVSVVLGIEKPTDEPVVVVVGDSWGSYGHDDLQKVLKEKGSNLTGILFSLFL